MKKFRVISFFIAIMMMIFLAGCVGKEQKSSSSDVGTTSKENGAYDGTINLCMSSWIGYGPLYVAQEKGIFKKNGVDVNLQKIESVSDINSSVASGKSQGCVVATGTFLIGEAAGINMEQILVLDDSYGGDGIVSKNDINSFVDLKGKKVAVSTDGDTSTLLFYYLLKKNGMSANDVQISNLSPGDAGAAFVGSSVDAAVTYEPWLTNAKKTDFGKMLVSSEETPGLIDDVLCMNKDFAQKYPKSVQKIVDSWFEALEYVKEHPDESNEIMAKSQDMELEDFKATLPTVRFYDKDKNKDFFNNKGINDITKQAGEIWHDLKLIDKDINYDDSIDGSFVNK